MSLKLLNYFYASTVLKMHVWLSMASMETDYNLKKLGQLNPLNPKIKI